MIKPFTALFKKVVTLLAHGVQVLLKGFIVLYQKGISPYTACRCRYVPTCSEYCKQALDQRGVRQGLMLGLKRIVRCHPWAGWGYDPVPENLRNEKVSCK